MMSLTLYLCRKNTFPGQMRCIFFSVSPRDREFPKTGHKMLAKWGIRLPNQFLSHNTLLQSKNQAKVAYFTKLMILIFGCPEEIRITNFTRMPLQIGIRYHLASLVLKVELTLRRRKAKVKVGITPTHFKINFPNGSLVIQVGSNYEKNPNNSDNKDNPS